MSTLRFHRTAAIVLRQFYLMRGSPAGVLPLFAWIAIDIVLWGFITRYLNSVAPSGFDFVTVLLVRWTRLPAAARSALAGLPW